MGAGDVSLIGHGKCVAFPLGEWEALEKYEWRDQMTGFISAQDPCGPHVCVIGDSRDGSRNTSQKALQKSKLEMMGVWTRAQRAEAAGSSQMLQPFMLL